MGNWSDYILKLFQSTLPRRERPFHFLFLQIRNLISIHTPTKGATSLADFKPQSFADFNPHSHEGSDELETKMLIGEYTISIHTPTKGATLILERQKLLQSISIHTPTKEATIFIVTVILRLLKFQSTLLRRERRSTGKEAI